MITNSRQNWIPGNTVKVGFLSLMVVAMVPTPGDFAPDAYLLASKNAFYSFVPHNGLTKLDANEAQKMIEDARRIAAHRAQVAMTKSAEEAKHAQAVKAVLDLSITA